MRTRMFLKNEELYIVFLLILLSSVYFHQILHQLGPETVASKHRYMERVRELDSDNSFQSSERVICFGAAN